MPPNAEHDDPARRKSTIPSARTPDIATSCLPAGRESLPALASACAFRGARIGIAGYGGREAMSVIALTTLLLTGATNPSASWATAAAPKAIDADGPRVLLIYDMEGLSGQDDIDSFAPVNAAYAHGQRLLTDDVNAVIDGLCPLPSHEISRERPGNRARRHRGMGRQVAGQRASTSQGERARRVLSLGQQDARASTASSEAASLLREYWVDSFRWQPLTGSPDRRAGP